MTAWTLFWLVCAGVVLFGGVYLVESESRHFKSAARPKQGFALRQGLIVESGQVPSDEPMPNDRDVHHTEVITSTSDETDDDRLRELMGIALTTPTPEAILEFSAFASRLHRLGPYNIYMVFAQRPGARAIASRADWKKAGQTVRPDALPILILRPKGPIMQVFELEDTLPQRDKDPRQDAFAAVGEFQAKTLAATIKSLASSPKRNLKVEIALEDLGSNRAGQISKQPSLPLSPKEELQGEPDLQALTRGVSPGHWRVKLNRRLTDAEKFATLLHELGHLFCGHVGAFDPRNQKGDEYGWPDRSRLPYCAKEVEAELVSWHICERWGLTTGSALYLRPHMERAEADMRQVDLDRVIRAIAKIEQFVPRRPTPLRLPSAERA